MSLLNYFRYFARLQLQKNPNATIIGITGSSGKTSTRLGVVHVLKNRGVVKSSIHANSQSGISLNILGLAHRTYTIFDWLRLMILAPYQYLTFQEHFDYYVCEMGIDGPETPNNMSYLLSILKPNVGVVLNAGLSHAYAFDSLVKDFSPQRRPGKIISIIAKEKMQLLKSISGHGVAIINIDQKELVNEKKDLKARVITYGKSKKADLQMLGKYKYLYQGIKYELNLSDIYPASFEYTFAAVISVCAALAIPPSISIKLLSSYRAAPGRMRVFKGINQTTLIDSSYNASPSSMQENLILLKKLAGSKKKIAVIGEMRELGSMTKATHKELSTWIMQNSDEAILFGDAVKEYTYPLLVAHKFKVHHFAKMSELVEYLGSIAKPHAHILFKGSQNTIFLERAIEPLLADKSDASLLCRRGPFWDEIRAKSP